MEHVAGIPLRVAEPVASWRDVAAVAAELLTALDSLGPGNVSLRRLTNTTIWELGKDVDYGDLLRLEPHTLFRRCYELICLRRSHARVSGPDLYLIVLMGLAATGLREMRYCEFCPRWACPGSTLCLYHSQSRLAPGTPSQKAARYRFGREVGEVFRRYVPEEPAQVALTDSTLPAYLAHLLWRAASPNEARTAAAVRRQIADSPALQELIGGDFDSLGNDRLYSRFQETVDPYEVRPAAWLWKLRLLRLWSGFGAALDARPRRTPFDAWRRLVKASYLERDGLSKAEIARRLDLSPSAISNWLRRYETKSLQDAVKKHIEVNGMTFRTDRTLPLDVEPDENLL
ncbi:MAG: helix-turn-helix domain-containing protein [Nitrospira sp.]|nr:helix-turn-helix domain-containing protein [Nitrospira sp.]